MFEDMMKILLIIALVATCVVLAMGIFAMFRSKKKNREEYSNRLMHMRIFFQAIALIILAILLYMGH